jgi:hypothetical protein
MNEHEMRWAIGVLVDRLTEAAFDCHDLEGAEISPLLKKAGLMTTRPATAEDCVRYSEFGVEPGDDYHELTPFAVDCRKAAMR